MIYFPVQTQRYKWFQPAFAFLISRGFFTWISRGEVVAESKTFVCHPCRDQTTQPLHISQPTTFLVTMTNLSEDRFQRHSLGQILGRSLQIWRSEFRSLVLISLLLAVPAAWINVYLLAFLRIFLEEYCNLLIFSSLLN